MKKLGLITLIGMILFTTGCGCQKEAEKEPEIIVSEEKEVIKDQEFEGLKMTNTSLVTVDGNSKLVTQVTNNTGKDYYLSEFKIIVKDSKGEVIATLPGYVGEVIPNGESRTIDSNTDKDLSSAKSIEYSVVK